MIESFAFGFPTPTRRVTEVWSLVYLLVSKVVVVELSTRGKRSAFDESSIKTDWKPWKRERKRKTWFRSSLRRPSRIHPCTAGCTKGAKVTFTFPPLILPPFLSLWVSRTFMSKRNLVRKSKPLMRSYDTIHFQWHLHYITWNLLPKKSRSSNRSSISLLLSNDHLTSIHVRLDVQRKLRLHSLFPLSYPPNFSLFGRRALSWVRKILWEKAKDLCVHTIQYAFNGIYIILLGTFSQRNLEARIILPSILIDSCSQKIGWKRTRSPNDD